MAVHGPNSAFAGLVNREVLNAVASPSGLLGKLKWVPSVFARAEVQLLTGFDAVSGTVPQSKCGTCQVVGAEKTCVLMWPFGRMCFTSPSITLEDTILRLNAGEPDFELVGSLVSPEVQEMLGRARQPDANILQAGIGLGMLKVARALAQSMSTSLWNGDPAGGTEAFMEPYGLEALTISNLRDAYTGESCGVGSVVVPFNDDYDAVSGSAFTLVLTLERVMATLEKRARSWGLMPATWAIVCSSELAYAIAQLWGRAYITTTAASSFPSNATLFVDAAGSVSLRERMMAEGVIRVNGKEYPLVSDDAVPFSVEGDTLTSSLYVVPLTVAGRPATYINYLDWKQSADYGAVNFITTDDGKVQWYTTNTGPCYQVTGVVVWRVVTLPTLAARITGITIPEPVTYLPSGIPGTPGYNSGGVASRVAPGEES